MRFIALFILAVLLVSVFAKGRKGHKKAKKRHSQHHHKKHSSNVSVKRHLIQTLSAGDPYGGIGPVIPFSGSQFQAGLQDGTLVHSDEVVRGDSRYDIPDEDVYNDQAYKHSESFGVDDLSHGIEPYHYHHPIDAFHWHAPVDGLHHYDDHLHHYDDHLDHFDDHLAHFYDDHHHYYDDHHDHFVDHHPHYIDHHAHSYQGDYGFPEYGSYYGHHHHHHHYHDLDPFGYGYVGNVLTADQAEKLGFDDEYLKKLGFEGGRWKHGSYYGSWGGRNGWGSGGRGGDGGPGRAGSGDCHTPIDLAFLIDSTTVKDNFVKFVEFAKAVVKRFDVSEEETRVGALTFSDDGHLKFAFDRHLSKAEVIKALDGLKNDYAQANGRKLVKGLEKAKADLFEVTGRDEKDKVLIILTDEGPSGSFEAAADKLKQMAVSIHVVGPREHIDRAEAVKAASSKEEWFVHLTDNYDKMISDVAPVVPKANCTVDLVFMVDCSRNDETELGKIKNFIKKSISRLSISTREDHVALVTYGGSAEAQTKFHLKKKTDRSSLLSSLDDLECPTGGNSGGDKALEAAKDVFERSGREDAIHVAIYITGKLPAAAVATRATELKKFGVRLYAVGYASEATEAGLKTVASLPAEFFVHDKENADKLEDSLWKTIANNLDELKGIEDDGRSGGYGKYGKNGQYGGYFGYYRSRGESQKSSSRSTKNTEASSKSGNTRGNIEESDNAETADGELGEREKIEGESLIKPALDADGNDDKNAGDSSGERRAEDSDGKKDPPKNGLTSVEGKKQKNKDESTENKIEKNSSKNVEKAKDEKSSFNGDKNDKSASDGAKNEKTATSEDDKKNKASTSNAKDKNAAARAGTPDPYGSIGSDVSSEESAMHLKPRISESSSSDAPGGKKADILANPTKGDEAAAENVHTDVVESNDAASSKSADAGEKRGLDKKTKKQDEEMLNKPVGSLVKSILDTAARHAVQDFSKSSGLKNVAKLLVKSAVQNALMSRPQFAKAFKAKKAKEGKAKKDNKKSHKKSKSKEDLVDEDNDKRQNTAEEPSVKAMEPDAKRSETQEESSVVSQEENA